MAEETIIGVNKKTLQIFSNFKKKISKDMPDLKNTSDKIVEALVLFTEENVRGFMEWRKNLLSRKK